MKAVHQSLILPATYVHPLHECSSLFHRQGDITLMEISLLNFYEKRQPLKVTLSGRLPKNWLY